jgi:hypothetical protein
MDPYYLRLDFDYDSGCRRHRPDPQVVLTAKRAGTTFIFEGHNREDLDA